MPIPVAANATCDIYRNAHAPPSAPDVAAVPCYLKASYFDRLETGESEDVTAQGFRFTHTFLMDLSVDVRDGYSAGSATLIAGTADFLYVPNQNGTKFIVKFVERKGRKTAWSHLKVYAARYNPPSWPTENL
jgi:hypothetical protein